MFLFIDTETTGFSKPGAAIQEGQGRVCQIAMLLTDDNGRSLAEFSSLIKPEGWTIGKQAGEIHGFTDALCDKYGMVASRIMKVYDDLASKAHFIIAHNVDFDRRMMEIEAAYAKTSPMPNLWYCTMKESTNVCNLPPTPKMLAKGINKPKPPKLEEALNILTGKTLGDGAHDAMYDVRGCKDVYFALQKRKKAA